MKTSIRSIFVFLLVLAGLAHGQMRKATGGTPAGTTGCGTGASVSGTDSAGIVTMGTTPTGRCTLNFSQTYGAAPACVAAIDDNAIGGVIGSPSTSTVEFSNTKSSNFNVGNHIFFICKQP